MTDNSKIRKVVSEFLNVRVVNVIGSKWFFFCWYDEDAVKRFGRNIKKRKEIIQKFRLDRIVPGVEYRESYWTSRSGKFLWGVRREKDDTFTLLKTGECNWTRISDLQRYLPREQRKFKPLIPGITQE